MKVTACSPTSLFECPLTEIGATETRLRNRTSRSHTCAFTAGADAHLTEEMILRSPVAVLPPLRGRWTYVSNAQGYPPERSICRSVARYSGAHRWGVRNH